MNGLTSTLRASPVKREEESMKHAIIMTGGKQYRVAEGDVIFVEWTKNIVAIGKNQGD